MIPISATEKTLTVGKPRASGDDPRTPDGYLAAPG